MNDTRTMFLNGWNPDNNYLDIIGLLLKAGADASAVIDSESGYTPLHRAAKDCDTAVIRLLLKFKADSLAKDKDGMTPLDIAKQYHCDAVEAILTRK